MKALSLWQPWASLMATRWKPLPSDNGPIPAAKSVETRSWFTPHRGDLAIQAAKSQLNPELAAQLEDNEVFMEGYRMAVGDVRFEDLPRGEILCVVRLVDVERTARLREILSKHELAFGDYTPGRFGWICKDMRPLSTPVPCRGMQQIFELPKDVAARVQQALTPGVVMIDPVKEAESKASTLFDNHEENGVLAMKLFSIWKTHPYVFGAAKVTHGFKATHFDGNLGEFVVCVHAFQAKGAASISSYFFFKIIAIMTFLYLRANVCFLLQIADLRFQARVFFCQFRRLATQFCDGHLQVRDRQLQFSIFNFCGNRRDFLTTFIHQKRKRCELGHMSSPLMRGYRAA